MTDTFQWERCDSIGNSCVDLSGETNSTYLTVSGDIGHTIRVRGYRDGVLVGQSNMIGPINPPGAPSVNVTLPVGPFSNFSTAQWYRDVAHPSVIDGLDVEDASDYGVGIMGFFSPAAPAPSPSAFTLTDIITQDIGHLPPTSNGTAEAGIWIGAQTNANRLVCDGTWEGLWTGAQCRNSLIQNFTIGKRDGAGGYTLPVNKIGLYLEHFTRGTTFKNFQIVSTENGINSEWWYADSTYASYVAAEFPAALSGKAGSCFNTFDTGRIYCPAGHTGIFLDAGTWGCTIKNIYFWGPGDAIGLPNNLAGPTNNTVDLPSCTFANTGQSVYHHSNGIG